MRKSLQNAEAHRGILIGLQDKSNLRSAEREVYMYKELDE